MWLTIVEEEPLILFSCGGHKESESHINQQKLGVSSTCKHACVLRTSLFDKAQGLGKESLTELYSDVPVKAADGGSGDSGGDRGGRHV